MSMTMLTIFQIIGVMAAYLSVVLLLPWILLHRRLAHLRMPARFMAYFMAGNFYCMNVVFLLQLLHISCRGLLVMGALVPFLAVGVFRYRESASSILESYSRKLRLIFEGEMGVRTLMLRVGNRLRMLSSGWLAEWLAPRWPDVMLTAGMLALVLYVYGLNAVKVYGYCASDMVLHNHWVNYMESSHIFVDGIYPFGFHCVMYYLHEVFSIPAYVLLRVFALTQTILIHMMLLAFLKLVCKSKYTPYIGVMAYIVWDIFYPYTYYRYFAPLPQEYGMMFILPAAYFAIAFLQEKDFISVAGKGVKTAGTARLYILFFAMGISLTLAVHFYDTMVIGLLCIGIAAGFCFRCLRWRYLKRLLLAGVTGILVAALPMAAAYAMGTPLQGSLHWGMNMISAGGGDSGVESRTLTEGSEEAGDKKESPKVSGARVPLGEKMDYILREIQSYVTNNSPAAAKFMLCSVFLLFALGILWYILRRPDYGAVLAAVSVFMGLLYILQASEKLGLPTLMDISRYSVYIAYGLPVVWSLCLDAVIYLLFRERRAIHIGGIAALTVSCVAVVLTGLKKPVRISAYESNDAIVCLTNILRENQGNVSWTICSANDEQQMTWGQGYHYELIEFLRKLEKAEGDAAVTIPTDTVYFFIEKVPILYNDYLTTLRPERKVAVEGAEAPLPESDGIQPYIGEERWVTMSHMYYWAQAFRKLYPNEMEVYYETEEFVCYRLRQDGYSLYDFAIDYGHNE